MNTVEMIQALMGVEPGTELFVSYVAGRKPTDRALREAERAQEEGLAKRHFVGRYEGVRQTKNGDVILTVLCSNRDDERHGKQEAYRSFNPALGTLLSLEVVG